MRGFNLKKTSQGVKDFLTTVPQPWLPGEIALIEKNITMSLDDLCGCFERSGFPGRTRQAIGKKRVHIARQRLKAFPTAKSLHEEIKMAGPKPVEVDHFTGKPLVADKDFSDPITKAEDTLVVPDKPKTFGFGVAIALLESGKKVARIGWNGKGMWLVHVPSTNVVLKPGTPYHDAGLESVTIDAHIDMFTAQRTMQPGWLASQADVQADDWCVVD